MPIPPPATRRDDVVDRWHGVDVADPYRWLEDGDDPDVVAWVAQQNERTRQALDARPDRGRWHERLVASLELPVVLGAQVRAGTVVSLERAAGADQARLVARPLTDPEAAPVVIADPAASADDGAVAVDWFHVSRDGELVAFGISEGGTERSVLHVARTADGARLPDTIPDTRACSLSWEPDGSGFAYTRYRDGDPYDRVVFHHRLGEPWADDELWWDDRPTPQTWPSVELSADGRWALVHASVGWGRHDVHLLDRASRIWRELIVGVDALTHLAFGDHDDLVGTTTLGAGRGRVVRVPLDALPTSPDGWTTLVAERDVVLGEVVARPGELLVTATRRATDLLERWRLEPDGAAVVATRGGAADGEPQVLDLGIAALGGVTVDPTDGAGLVVVSSFESPPALWSLPAPAEHPDDHVGASVSRWWPAAPHDLVPLRVTETSYRSTDGTDVGIFLVHRADLRPDASTPTVLTGYGGFAISMPPAWSPTVAAWTAAGGQYALAGLRGGLEHGDEWHRAGRREHKQQVFDDFAAAADWLVDTGRTSRDRLAISGRSNGGLLVGAALTQRPDLCRAVWCGVPLLDMVRFPRFLIAELWTDEYGDPEVADEFGWLHAYSPYHRVVPDTCYPAVLLTTATGDSRVDPLHARKMAALLQHEAGCQDERPVLLHEEGRAGHGVGKPVNKVADELADALAFFSWHLGGPVA